MDERTSILNSIKDLKLEVVPLTKIKPYDKNPRINDHVVDKIVESIKLNGFRAPLIVDQNYRICGGHTRFKAVEKLGLKEVPVIRAAMTEEQFVAFNIADNKTVELAEWNFEMLELNLKGLNLDMSLLSKATGFREDEIEQIFSKDELSLISDEKLEAIKMAGETFTNKLYLHIFFDTREEMEKVRSRFMPDDVAGNVYLDGKKVAANLNIEM